MKPDRDGPKSTARLKRSTMSRGAPRPRAIDPKPFNHEGDVAGAAAYAMDHLESSHSEDCQKDGAVDDSVCTCGIDDAIEGIRRLAATAYKAVR